MYVEAEERRPEAPEDEPDEGTREGSDQGDMIFPASRAKPRDLTPADKIRRTISVCRQKRAPVKPKYSAQGLSTEVRTSIEKSRKKQQKDMNLLLEKARVARQEQKKAEKRVAAREKEINAERYRQVKQLSIAKSWKEWGSTPSNSLQLLYAWKNNARAEARATATAKFVVASTSFHSVKIAVEFWNGEAWVDAVAIADTGSGVTIVAEQSVVNSIPPEQRTKPTVRLVTADGAPLRGIVGSSADVKFRFKGSRAEHRIGEAQLSDSSDTTSILGNDIWDQTNAVFNFGERRIHTKTFTMDEDGYVDGEITESVPFSVNDEPPEELTTTEADGTTATRVGQVRVSTSDAPEGLIAVRARRDYCIPPHHHFEAAEMVELDIPHDKTHAAHHFALSPVFVPNKPGQEDSEDGSGNEDKAMILAPMTVRPSMRQSRSHKSGVVVTAPAGIANPTSDTVLITAGQIIGYAQRISPNEVKRAAPSVDDEEFAKLEAEAQEARRVADDSDYDSEGEEHDEAQDHATQCEDALEYVRESRRVTRLYAKAHTSFSNQQLDGCTSDADKDWLQTIDEMEGDDVVKMVQEGQKVGSESFEEWLARMGDDFRVGPRTSPELRMSLARLLYALQGIVSKDHLRPGMIADLEMGIDLKDNNMLPVKSRYRRYSPQEKRIIKEEVDKMMANGIVEYSDSPWSAPVVLVRKKDGSWRFCVNFTATVNPHIVKDAMPIPRCQDILDGLSKATLMSLWDVNSGYWSLRLRVQDRKFTAFATESHGLLQFTRAPFGLTTSGNFFQRAIETVLRTDRRKRRHPPPPDPDLQHDPERDESQWIGGPLLHRVVDIFVDDGTIHTQAHQNHVNEVFRVLMQLRRNNVTIKLKKCIWGTDEATLIGHEVRCGVGISPDREKVKDMLAMTRLGSIGELKSFNGSTVYMSRFIKDYAELTEPLYELQAKFATSTTKLHEPRMGLPQGHWTPACEVAFKTVKAALATAPVLAFPDFERPFVILADASKKQYGGVLVQLDDEGQERIIAFTSRRMNSTQLGYGVTSKEGLAVQHCVRHWRSYIHGQPTVVVTDHSALTSLRTKHEFDTQRLSTLSAELMEYDLHIVHRPGKFCDLADLMSRAEIEQDPAKRETMAQELLSWRAHELMKAYAPQEPTTKPTTRRRQPKPDDLVADAPEIETRPPWIRNRAEATYAEDTYSDTIAPFSKESIDRQIALLLRGSSFKHADGDLPTVELVQEITEKMRAGTYEEYNAPDTWDNADEDDSPALS